MDTTRFRFDARLVGITVGVTVLGSAMAAITGGRVGAAVALRWAQPETPAPMPKEVCHA